MGSDPLEPGNRAGFHLHHHLSPADFQHYGHSNVPQNPGIESTKLSDWVNYRRKYYKYFDEEQRETGLYITNERIAQLEAIGFDWSTAMRTDRSNLPQDSTGLGPVLFCLRCTWTSLDHKPKVSV